MAYAIAGCDYLMVYAVTGREPGTHEPKYEEGSHSTHSYKYKYINIYVRLSLSCLFLLIISVTDDDHHCCDHSSRVRKLQRPHHVVCGRLGSSGTIAECPRQRRMEYKTALGTKNQADLMTKHLPKEEIQNHCQIMSVYFEEGSANSARTLNVLTTIYGDKEINNDTHKQEDN